MRDIYPAEFHKTLTYYIGTLRKPIAVDYRRDPVVDTHVISGYTLSTRRTGSNTFAVTARLRVHKYDGARTNNPGAAPSYTRTYSYVLREDSNGRIVSGYWTSGDNPDFLWVPLSGGDCRSHPRMRRSWVEDITR